MKEPQDRSGELLFSRYAYPCAFDRLLNGHISQIHFEELEICALRGQPPRRELLRYCYPHAFRGLRAFAKETGSDRWDTATVQKFWRTRHGHSGDCAVTLCAIVNVNSDTAQAVDAEGREYKLINYYRLPLEVGAMVYVHRRVIVERM